jgi:hypothetical protein
MKKNPISVAFMPDYIVTALKAKGIGLEDIDALASGCYDHTKENKDIINYRTERDKVERLNDILSKNISKNDIVDMILANRLLTTHLLSKYFWEVRNNAGVSQYIRSELPRLTDWMDSQEKLNEFKLLYADKNINIEAINMSKDNNEENVWEFKQTENTLFVVLRSGFTNFIVYPGLEKFKDDFIMLIVNYMFKVYGEQETTRNGVFQTFIKKIK